MTRTSLQSNHLFVYGCAPFEDLCFSLHTRGGTPDSPSSNPGDSLAISFAHHTDCPGSPYPSQASSFAIDSFSPPGTRPWSSIADEVHWGGGSIALRSARIAFPLCPPKSTILRRAYCERPPSSQLLHKDQHRYWVSLVEYKADKTTGGSVHVSKGGSNQVSVKVGRGELQQQIFKLNRDGQVVPLSSTIFTETDSDISLMLFFGRVHQSGYS